jgi:hypothetical protein
MKTGDLISINGSDGSIYLGKHPSTVVRRQRLAEKGKREKGSWQ